MSPSASGLGIGEDLRRFGGVPVKHAGGCDDRLGGLMIYSNFQREKYELNFSAGSIGMEGIGGFGRVSV